MQNGVNEAINSTSNRSALFKTFAMIACLALAAAALMGCRKALPPDPGAVKPSSPPSDKSQVTYSGGDGSSMEQAVLIKGAAGEGDGVVAEMAWLAKHHPGFREEQQSLLGSGARKYDAIKITTREGEKTVYFDITDFFGK